MRSLFKAFTSVAALLLVVTGGARAQVAYNTGAAANVNGSFQDSKWQVSVDGGASWFQAYQVQGPPSPPWQANTSLYSWISATTSGSGGGGSYLFRSFFDLTGFDPLSASMSFQCAVDNETPFGGYFSLNGGMYGGVCGSGNSTGFLFAGMQTISSGFITGLNEIRFTVVGDSQTDGLVVGNTHLAAGSVTVPEPASMVLVATGLIGVLGMARRRRTARGA